MDLITIFRVLFRRIFYLAGIPAFVIVVVFILTSGYTRLFRSTARLATGFTVTKEINLTEERFNLYEAGVKFSNLIETMNSASVISLVSYRLLLHDLDSSETPFTRLELKEERRRNFVKSLDYEWIKRFCRNSLDSFKILNTYNPQEKDLQKLLEFYQYDFKSLSDKITVKRVNTTDYITVDAYTENPFLSAYVVNTLCDEYLRYNSSQSDSEKENAIETYARLVAEKRQELANATTRLQRFKASNSIINSDLERDNIVTRISDIEQELKVERQNLSAKILQLEDLERRLGGVTTAGVTNADVINIRNQISDMNERYLRNGSSVLRDSLQILRQTQQRYIQMLSGGGFNRSFDEMANEKAQLQVDIQILRQKINDLEESVTRSSGEIGGFASKEARIASLERELNLASEDYRDAQENYSRALNVSISSSSTTSQVLLGLPATKPEPSKRVIVSAASGVSTFVFLVLIIILLEYLDVSIKTGPNFISKTQLSLIGSLNHIEAGMTDLERGLFKKLKSKIFGKGKRKSIEDDLLVDDADSSSNYFLSFFKKSASADKERLVFRDQLRKIRYSLINSQKKVILFSSTKPSEGKTSLIAALAAALNESHSRVLIIDTNFGNPNLTKMFKGLKVLEEFFKHKKKSNSEASKTFTAMFANNVGLPYVDVIGCKGGEYTPIEIIEGDALKNLIEDIKDKYDFIFFEGAALNSNSGSRELSSYVEGVVTVFSAKSNLDQLDFESIDFIKGLKDKNMGSILNDVELRDMNKS